MKDMTYSQLSGLIDIKDKQVFAYFTTALNQHGKEKMALIQSLTDQYASDMAKNFIAAHKDFFAKEENKALAYEKIKSLGADKPHSGRRFSEFLYKHLKSGITLESVEVEEEEEKA